MTEIGGPATELIATLGAVIAGGAAIGSLLGGAFAFGTRKSRPEILEFAGAAALVVGLLAVQILIAEEIT